jgi:uncharacterized protein (TIGR03437 family)
VFSVAIGGQQQTHPYIAVYNSTTGQSAVLDLKNSQVRMFGSSSFTPISYQLGYGVHASFLDRSGRYVYITRGDVISSNANPNIAQDMVWDTQTGQVGPLGPSSCGHNAVGYGAMVNQCGTQAGNDSDGWWLRQFSDVSHPIEVALPEVSPPSRWTTDGHPSWNNARPGVNVPFAQELYVIDSQNPYFPTRAWDGEIIAVPTDGSSTIWRFAHVRSILNGNFYDQPRANISQDGRYVLFTSNWENTLGLDVSGNHRLDVFLVELDQKYPASPVADTVPPSKPVFLHVTSNATVGGVVDLTAAATDNVGVAAMNYRMGTNLQGPEITTAPYTFQLDTTKLANGQYTIQAIARDAQYNVSVSDPVVFYVNNSAPGLSGIAVSPNTLQGGQTAAGTVTLSAAAGTGGVAIALSSSNPAAASVPSTVTVPQGASSAGFTVTAGTIATATAVTLTASYQGVSTSSSLTINPGGASSGPTSGASVAFVALDTTTQGAWKSKYGSDGYTIVDDSSNNPGYVIVSPSSAADYVWASSTTDVRALQKSSGTDRIASTWYAKTVFNVDLNFTDRSIHQVAIYCLDWDFGGRAQTVEVLDGASSTVLDTRSIANFSGGVYLVWNISGHVKLRVTQTSASFNGVVSGVFFAPGAPSPCSYSLSAAGASVVSAGGTGTANVTTATGCPWTASSNSNWIAITSGSSGSGNGVVNYSVAPNTGASRSGTILIAGQTHTVSQSAPIVSNPLTIANASLANGTVGIAYQQALQTTGGCQAAPVFSIAIGTLPDGLVISGQLILGSPQKPGSFSFVLQASDGCGHTTTRSFVITIANPTPPPVATLAASPSTISFTVQQGSAALPPNQTISVTGSGSAALSYTASVAAGGNWLSIRPGTTFTTPGILTLGMGDYAGLTPATYNTAVIIAPAGGGTPVPVAVTLTVQPTPILSATPAAVSFTSIGSNGPLQSQQVSVSSSAPAQYTITFKELNGTGWLSVKAVSGSTPDHVGITVRTTGLIPDTYRGQVVVTPAPGRPLTIPVTLIVAPSTALTASTDALSFDVQAGASSPATRMLSVGSGAAVLDFTAAAATQSNAEWLSVDPPAGSTPSDLRVSVKTSGLVPGHYTGTVSLSASDPSIAPVTIPISVTVRAAAGPIITALTNAASFLPGPVAPGQIVVLFGSGLGPANLIRSSVSAAGLVDSELAGTRVLFDDVAAPIIYTSSGQIAAIVPSAVATKTTTRIQVEYQGVSSSPLDVYVVAANPGIFTLDRSGQGAILNEDQSVNSGQNGADPGSIISIYGTGGGQTDWSGADGAPPTTAASLKLPVSLKIDEQDAAVLYAGIAPGLAGVLQVNARVPEAARRGVSLPVFLTVGSARSQGKAMLAIKP